MMRISIALIQRTFVISKRSLVQLKISTLLYIDERVRNSLKRQYNLYTIKKKKKME